MANQWDYFIDYCEAEGLDPEVEDFEAWREEQWERAQDAAAERFQAHMEELAWAGREGWL